MPRDMRLLLVAVMLVALGCGGRPPIPARLVVESDVGTWKFRRFQGPLLDVEVWVQGNQAEAFSASYITAEAEARGRIEDQDLVSVIVTRYAAPDGVVRATVKLARRLAQQEGYQIEEEKIGGARALTIHGHGEAWVIWPSDKHVVRVGGRGRRDVPASMVEPYAERYPSQLPGGSLEGPLPPGPDEAPAKKPAKPAYDASDPRPDIDHYDPGKVKLPDKKPDEDAAPAAPAAGEEPAPAAEEPAPTPKPAKRKKPRKAR